MLFAYASCMANNGQTMAGLNANHPFYNLTTAVAMAAGRFGLAALALTWRADSPPRSASRRRSARCRATRRHSPSLVLGSVLLVGALCFLPALVLGPIAEYLHP